MIESITLNVFFLLALLFTLWEHSINIAEQQIKNTRIQVTMPTLLTTLCLGFLFTIVFVLKGPKDIVQMYILLSIGVLNIANSLWITINKQGETKIAGILFALASILLRLLFPSFLTHNFFLIFAIPWIGPLFTKLRIITPRRFIAISILLFIYDIAYVWLTPLSTAIHTATSAARIPLGLVAGGYVLGAGDVLFASIAICLLKSRLMQCLAILLFLGSNVLLDVYSEYFQTLSVFPMLVLWAPIAVGLVIISSWGKERKEVKTGRERS
jgi:hypothetical protein